MTNAQLLELFGRLTCEICQERLDDDGNAEMFHPDHPQDGTLMVHGGCGLSQGMVVA